MGKNGLFLFILFFGWNITFGQSTDSLYFEENLRALEYPFETPENKEQLNSTMVNQEYLKLLLVILLIVSILALIFFLSKLEKGSMRRDVQNSKLLKILQTETIHKNFIAENIEELILAARHSGDLRLMNRAFYLGRIKALHDAGMLVFSIDKTNREYVQELQDPVLKKQFQEATDTYEALWFGKASLALYSYDEMKAHYDSFLNSIRQTKKAVV